ncbi:hypothetical protein [Nitrosomonas sp. Nm34]|uniref:hypothetical protein n=1 Tax=Nitrosomonas sp. Nm34 TaxID=1881055 RepID=UPI000B8225EC|nr:hypothetical protein [Nitrosomonas sp. Nm34]
MSAPPSTNKIPPSAGATDEATEALAIAMTLCPAPNWLVVSKQILPPAERQFHISPRELSG